MGIIQLFNTIMFMHTIEINTSMFINVNIQIKMRKYTNKIHVFIWVLNWVGNCYF